MQRIGPTENTNPTVPFSTALANDFQQFHSGCTVILTDEEKKREAFHAGLVEEFIQCHEEFIEALQEDVGVAHTINKIQEYHNFMLDRYEEYQEQCDILENAASGQSTKKRPYDSDGPSDRPDNSKRQCTDDACNDDACNDDACGEN